MRPNPNLEALRSAADTCVSTTLKKASRSVAQMYDHALEPSGLTTSQFSLLVSLYYLPGISVKKLAARSVMERTTLTRNLDVLQKLGLVEVARDEADRRVKVVLLTTAGREAIDRALPLWEGVQQRMVSNLGEEQWSALRKLLRLSIAVVRQDSSSATAEA